MVSSIPFHLFSNTSACSRCGAHAVFMWWMRWPHILHKEAHMLQLHPAGGGRPRDYQDERFSYVVLQRGGRPEAPAGVFLSSPEVETAAAPDVELLKEDSEDDVVEEVPALRTSTVETR